MALELLEELGRKVRALRVARGWTLRDFATRSGMSTRFLGQVEAGRGNISVLRLADVARALEVSPAQLLDLPIDRDDRVVALLGLRGAGKTSVGRRLAKRLRVPFVELDGRVELAANMSLAELFSLHGEGYYRRLEREALQAVLDERRAMVLATGGGIVTAPDTYALLRRSATTVWLRASTEDHWHRVVSQGDRRPMADHPQAMTDLHALLAAREPLYAAAAHIVDTSGRPVQRIVDAITDALGATTR